MSHPDDMTVNDLIEVLSQLPDEVRTYTVWLEADPSTPLSKDDRPEINHEQRRILL